MTYLVGYLVWGVIWGFATSVVIQNKGYNESWFLWGFLFGIIAFLVACAKPANYEFVNYYNTNEAIEKLRGTDGNIPYGSWRCSRCGRINNSYVGTCSCGVSKLESERRNANIAGNNANSTGVSVTSNNTSKVLSESERADAILKYKNLMDANIITEEEFNMKKRELLNLKCDGEETNNENTTYMSSADNMILRIIKNEADGISAIDILKQVPRNIGYNEMTSSLKKLCEMNCIEMTEGKYYEK